MEMYCTENTWFRKTFAFLAALDARRAGLDLDYDYEYEYDEFE